ncbi:MAG: PIG-L deacetylase family protein [Actinomycetes bacterium]
MDTRRPADQSQIGQTTGHLPPWQSILAVVAHPDDESFGLGAVISTFIAAGARVDVLCYTKGEASTLHGVEGDLALIRRGELTDAARELGITSVYLLDYPDGHLADQDLAELAEHAVGAARDADCDGLLVFDSTGITGHADHIHATRAAVVAAPLLGLDVLAWTLPADVANELRTTLGGDFRGRPRDAIDFVIDVDRDRQQKAVHCHPSQAVPSSALWHRLDLLGNREYLRWIVRQEDTTR